MASAAQTSAKMTSSRHPIYAGHADRSIIKEQPVNFIPVDDLTGSKNWAEQRFSFFGLNVESTVGLCCKREQHLFEMYTVGSASVFTQIIIDYLLSLQLWRHIS